MAWGADDGLEAEFEAGVRGWVRMHSVFLDDNPGAATTRASPIQLSVSNLRPSAAVCGPSMNNGRDRSVKTLFANPTSRATIAG
jgi:hypothetical protein